MEVWLALALVASDAAEAPPPPAGELRRPKADDDDAPDPLAVGAALVPGLVVHGAGHWARGDRATAKRLLALEGLGVGLILSGGIPIVSSGASRYLAGPGAAMVIAGLGAFGVSALADLYGVLVPDGGLGAPRAEPMASVAVGYLQVRGARFAGRHFATASGDLRLGHFRLTPRVDWNDGNARQVLHAGARIGAADDAWAELVLGGAHHAFDAEGFRTWTGEAALRGHLPLRRLAEPLVGSYAELLVGWAHRAVDYVDVPDHGEELLLARFTFGMHVGRGRAPRADVEVFYDHRHDGFASGLLMPGLGSGVGGYFGILARTAVVGPLGLVAELQAGSAFAGSLAVTCDLPGADHAP